MCGEEENTAENFLEQCPAIAQIRGQYFQDLSVNEQLIVAEELDVYQTGVTITISDYILTCFLSSSFYPLVGQPGPASL